jgi:hypothetical protein
MTIQAVAWAIETRVGDPTLKVLLMALANHANSDEWEAWPKLETLAFEAEISKRTVQRGLERLKQLGLISIEHSFRPDGSQTSSRIRLLRGGQIDTPSRGQIGTLGCHSSDVGRVTELCPAPGDNKVATPNEPSLEPSLEPSKTPVASKATKRATDSEIDQIFEERFWPVYPKRLGSRGKPEAKKKFRTVVRSGGKVEKIIDAATKLAADWVPRISRKPADAQFIPMAATWLNKGRWDDEPDELQGDDGPPIRGAETMFDLANHFENRVRETSYGQATAAHYHDGDAAAGANRLIDG